MLHLSLKTVFHRNKHLQLKNMNFLFSFYYWRSKFIPFFIVKSTVERHWRTDCHFLELDLLSWINSPFSTPRVMPIYKNTYLLDLNVSTVLRQRLTHFNNAQNLKMRQSLACQSLACQFQTAFSRNFLLRKLTFIIWVILYDKAHQKFWYFENFENF